MKNTYKQKIKIIFILVLAISMIFMIKNNTYANGSAGYLQRLEEMEEQGEKEGKSMSAEAIQDAIQDLEAEMNERMNDDPDYDEEAQEMDRAKLRGYKTAYQKKAGQAYGSESTGSITDPIINPSAYDPSTTQVESTKLQEIIRQLVSILTTIGIGVGVIAMAIIGIKYMVASLEERAKYKETMIPYLVGVTMVITISTILKILSNIFYNNALLIQ